MQLALQALRAGNTEEHGHEGYQPAKQAGAAEHQAVSHKASQGGEEEEKGADGVPASIETEGATEVGGVYLPDHHPGKELQGEGHTGNGEQDESGFDDVFQACVGSQQAGPRCAGFGPDTSKEGKQPAEQVEGLEVDDGLTDLFLHDRNVFIG